MSLITAWTEIAQGLRGKRSLPILPGETESFDSWKVQHINGVTETSRERRWEIMWGVWQAAVVAGISSVANHLPDNRELVSSQTSEKEGFEQYRDRFYRFTPYGGDELSVEEMASDFWNIGFANGVARVIGAMKIPAGWQLVPINPTTTMYNAGYQASVALEKSPLNKHPVAPDMVYKAMLESTPQFKY